MTAISVYVPHSLSVEDRKKMIKSFENIGWEFSDIIKSGKFSKDYSPISIILAYKFIWDRFDEYIIPDNLPDGCHIEYYKM